jgi:NADH:ubiquinone oxidoreductase subunit 6 (subunit J)
MINGVVNVLEFASLFFGLTVALFSILKPQIKNGVYSLFVLLPLAIIMSVFFSHAEAKEDRLKD